MAEQDFTTVGVHPFTVPDNTVGGTINFHLKGTGGNGGAGNGVDTGGGGGEGGTSDYSEDYGIGDGFNVVIDTDHNVGAPTYVDDHSENAAYGGDNGVDNSNTGGGGAGGVGITSNGANGGDLDGGGSGGGTFPNGNGTDACGGAGGDNGDGGTGGTGYAILTWDELTGPQATLTATPISTTEIDLSWTDNDSQETGYEIWRSTNGSDYSYHDSIAADSTSYPDTGLSPATQYWYKVRAVNVGFAESDPADATTLSSGATSRSQAIVSG